MPEEFLLDYFDSESSSDRLRTLRSLFESDSWKISEWPDPSTGPKFKMRVRFVGSASISEIRSPFISYLVRALSSQTTSDTTLAAVRMASSSISPHLRDGTISGLSIILPDKRTLRFESRPRPSVTLGEHTVPIDATASHIAALELLQDLEYSFDFRIKFASIDNKGRYVGDSFEEYESFLAGLPQGWRQDPDDFRIQTRSEGTRRAWHLRNNDLDVAVVEHETGVEFLGFLLGIAVNLASSALYDLIKGSLEKWREKRQFNASKSATIVEIERTRKSPDRSLLSAEVTRIRDPVDDALLRSAIERMVQSMPSDTAMAEHLSVKEAFELYEDGKHRRYSLLFSVNGGAFAVAKLLTGEPGKPGIVLGDLSLSQLSLGMVLFTAVMIWDIFVFGLKMRKHYLPGAFETQGKIVLLLLGVLLCLGWFLVGRRGTFFA